MVDVTSLLLHHSNNIIGNVSCLR